MALYSLDTTLTCVTDYWTARTERYVLDMMCVFKRGTPEEADTGTHGFTTRYAIRYTGQDTDIAEARQHPALYV